MALVVRLVTEHGGKGKRSTCRRVITHRCTEDAPLVGSGFECIRSGLRSLAMSPSKHGSCDGGLLGTKKYLWSMNSFGY